MRIETQLIHAGEERPYPHGAATLPIFQSSTFEHGESSGYHDVRYARLSNTPNHLVLGRKLASLERAEAALVTASGMAAIAATLLTLLSSGDHLIAHRSLYGGTHTLLVRDLAALGITTTFVDTDDLDALARAKTMRTKAVYVETMTNPLLDVVDLAGVARFARENGLVSIIDNTLASPINFRPIERGLDIVVHSATKYLNGHSDVIAGAVMSTQAFVDRIKQKLDHLGGSLDPHACFLLHRGLKTLALRIAHQNQSAHVLAKSLARHPAVSMVRYPALESHPRHARARELFSGMGGLLSFELRGGVDAAERVMRALELPICAPSLGGSETLVTRPVTTSHAGLSPEERERQGISSGLVRVAVGLESAEDLVADFQRALDSLARTNP
jgi:cystathionine beta-lyase/cystathionine gamma-synthase